MIKINVPVDVIGKMYYDRTNKKFEEMNRVESFEMA